MPPALLGFGEPADGERRLGEICKICQGSKVIGVPPKPGFVQVEGFCEGKQLIMIKRIQRGPLASAAFVSASTNKWL